MSKSAYPSEGDLYALLVSAGMMTNPKTGADVFTDLGGALDDAKSGWEEDTGLIPFILDANDATCYYDPPGNHDAPNRSIYGTLRGGGRSLYLPSQGNSVFTSITSVTIGYNPNFAGTLLTVNQDYWIEPEQSALNSRPYEWITFAGRQFGGPRSIVVVGKRGWPNVPEEVYRAIVRRAAAKTGIEIAARMGALKQIKMPGAGYTFADRGPYADQMDRWNADYQAAVCKYRVSVV